MRFDVFTVVRFWHCVDSSVDANVSKKYTVSIFRAEALFSETLASSDEST
jgi:hypothetical protein